MKNSVFLVLCVLVVLTIAAPSFMIPLIALALLAYLFIKTKSKRTTLLLTFPMMLINAYHVPAKTILIMKL